MKKTILFLLFPVFILPAFAQSPLFKDATSTAGIDHQFQDVFPEMGSGAVFFDLNNDNYLDLFLTGGLLDNSLYLNNGDGTFKDITASSGLKMSNVRKLGAVSGDLDNDGYRDLLVTTAGGYHCYLFRNLGNNSFQNITYLSGIHFVEGGEIEDQWSFSPTMGDVNLDGYLDIYINNWISEGQAIYDSITHEIIGYAHKGEPNRLYLNNGNMTFTEVADSLNAADQGCALSGIFTDYDNDRDMDILIANDFGPWWIPDAAYQNQYPEIGFLNVSAGCGFDTELYGMGVGVGDYDQDGDLDYYKTSIGSHVLMQNNGDGSFNEVAAQAGVQQTYVNGEPPYLSIGWGAGFLDFDNDTWLDLVVAQGALTEPDFFLPSLDSLPDKIFRNLGDGTFEDAGYLLKTPNLQKSRGFAYGDVDNDGDIDLVFTSPRDYLATGNPGTPVLFENQLDSSNNWFKVKTEGTVNNRDGFGTHLLIYVNGQSWRYEIGGGGHGHNSQHSSIAHFGLGTAEKIDSLIVQWPGDMTEDQKFYDLQANLYIKIVESEPEYEIIQGSIISDTKVVREGSGIRLFPNPAGKYTNLSLDSDFTGEAMLILYDMMGKRVKVQSIHLNGSPLHTEIDLTPFLPGLYLVNIKAGQEEWWDKLVVE